MADPRVLTLTDLSEAELELLKLRDDAKFSEDGKTVTLPPDPVDDRGIPDFAEGVKKLPVPPPPEHIAKRLAEGFTPPSSIVVEEDGKVVKAAGVDAKPGDAVPPPAAPSEHKPKTATDDDLREYLRCLLGGQRFTKSYEFMGGHVKVTLRERTTEEDEDVIRRTSITAAAQGQGNNAVALTLLMAKYRLAYSITSLEIGANITKYEKIGVGEMLPGTPLYKIDQRVAELGDISSAVGVSINIALMEFSEICTDITRRATDPKSWQTLSAV